MYLKKLHVENYRALRSISINFQKGLNIIIGGNNAGKTAIIDALRICLSIGNQRKDIYVSLDDFYIDKSDPEYEVQDIEFHLYFEIEEEGEVAYYNQLFSVVPADDQELNEIQLHFKYYIETTNGVKRVKYKIWGGDNEGQRISPEVLDLFNTIYLSPLRDALKSLRPSRGNILGDLFTKLETDSDKQKELASKVQSALHDDEEWQELISSGQEEVISHLSATTISGRQQDVMIDFLPFEFRRIVESLLLQIPVFKENDLNGDPTKQKYFSLYQNGLGYNNLIYIATVLGNLNKLKELESARYVALLLEEPEAHLHPQLQDTFFNHLESFKDSKFQLFVSSHSPVITAKSSLSSLIVLQKNGSDNHAFSLTDSPLNDTNIKYLSKFLDVTKSQLFFANGVILVEGISEALLLPVFSKIMGDTYDIEKNGVELVNINGVAFEHFAKLFNSEEVDKRVNQRCVIFTDDDRDIETEEISSRANIALGFQAGTLKVELAVQTFEFELMVAGDNFNIIHDTFRKLHPVAANNMVVDPGDTSVSARNLLKKIVGNKAKSRLAHQLAMDLEEDETLRGNFTVPEYIQRGITYIITGQ